MSNVSQTHTPLPNDVTGLFKPPSLDALKISPIAELDLQQLFAYHPNASSLQTSNCLVGLDDMKVRHLSASKTGKLVVTDEHGNKSTTQAAFSESQVVHLDRRQRVAFDIPSFGLCLVSDRFWQSWGQLFKLHRSVFNYFGYGEAFRRVQSIKNTSVQLTLEKWPANQAGIAGRLLAVVSEGKPLVHPSAVKHLFTSHNAKETSYQSGVLSAQAPCPFPVPYDLGDIKLVSSMHIEIPLDGYGKPAVFLAFDMSNVDLDDEDGSVHQLTCVCRNKAFRTEFQTTKDVNKSYSVLSNSLKSFANEEGFMALKVQFQLAANSWASMREYKKLELLIRKAVAADVGTILSRLRAPMLLDDLTRLSGDPYRVHGHANVLEMSQRRASTTPAPVSVLRLILFAAKLTTKVLVSQEARKLMSDWIGDTLLDEMDLVESRTMFPRFSQVFTKTQLDDDFLLAADDEHDDDPLLIDGEGEEDEEDEEKEESSDTGEIVAKITVKAVPT